MTLVKDIAEHLNNLFPPETAEEYDNPGLMTGSLKKNVRTCRLSLDVTSDVIDECEHEAELLIVHHPLIFGGVDSVTYDDPSGRLISRLIANDISCFAVHTNLDKNFRFSNRYLAKAVGDDLLTSRPLEGTSCGVVFDLPEKIYLGDYIEQVKEGLDVTGVITINDLNSRVKSVFAQGGAFDEDSIPALIEAGVEVVVSGEIKHHIAVLLSEYGIKSIIAGHRETERIFMPVLADELTKRFPDVRFLVSL